MFILEAIRKAETLLQSPACATAAGATAVGCPQSRADKALAHMLMYAAEKESQGKNKMSELERHSHLRHAIDLYEQVHTHTHIYKDPCCSSLSNRCCSSLSHLL